jgi:hypothetical protein
VFYLPGHEQRATGGGGETRTVSKRARDAIMFDRRLVFGSEFRKRNTSLDSVHSGDVSYHKWSSYCGTAGS